MYDHSNRTPLLSLLWPSGKQTVLQTATLRETPSGIFDDRPNSDVHFHYFRGLVEIDESKSDYNFKLNDESTTSPDNKPIYIL